MQKKSLLIIGFVWVEPNSSAAGNRLLQLIELFLKHLFTITFACAAKKSDNAFALQKLGIQEVEILLNDASFDAFITNLAPDFVLFDRFVTEEQFGWRVLEYCPKAMTILDTEDLHCLRKTREICLKNNIDFSFDQLKKQDITKREIAAILRCDLSLIISTFEMDLLQSVFKMDKKNLFYLPFLFDKIEQHQQQVTWKTFAQRNHFIFVGNFLHKPNVDAVITLKNEIWSKIREYLPEAEIHIYGAYVTQQIQQLHNKKEGFIIKGFAENAKEVVANAKVVLAPLRFGAGIKGKLTEAMLCGTPSITTTIGAEGMCQNFPWNGFVINDFSDFALNASLLYKNKSLWENAQLAGKEIINYVYDKEKFEKPFIDKILEIQENIEQLRNENFLGSLLQYQTLQSTKYLSKWIEEKSKN